MRRALARLMLLLVVLAALALPGAPVHAAEEVAVPIGLQAELLAKVAAYDKNFVARAGERAHVLILTRPNDVESVRAAAHLDSALRAIRDIGGLPHDEATIAYPGPKALVDACKARRIAIVYVGPALGAEVEAIRDALTGTSVLTVGVTADYVPRGIVLGFDVVSGKPKLVVHLGQARKQDVVFKAEVLKLMRVIE